MTDIQIINKVEEIRLQAEERGLPWVMDQLEQLHIQWDNAQAKVAEKI